MFVLISAKRAWPEAKRGLDFHRRRRRPPPAPAPPESSGSYRARPGGGLQELPRGASARGAAAVLERLARIAAPGAGLGSPPPRRQVVVEGGRLRGDGRADDEVGRRPRREHAARHRLGAARESTTTSFSRPRSSPGRGRAGRHHGNRSRPLASRRYRGGFTGVASQAADRAPVEMRGGLHRASHGARPLRPALQPASARVSG